MAFSLPDALAVLRRTPDTLDALFGGLDDGWTRHRPAPDEWSGAEIVGHLIHGERTDWVPRARIILAHGTSRPFDPFDREPSVGAAAIGDLLGDFRSLRAQNLDALRSWELTESDLDREGTHPTFGNVKLRQHLATWATHDHVHLAQIAQALASRYVIDIGPWRAFLWEK